MTTPRQSTTRPPPRPRRGTPEATRARLVACATREFARAGYLGTDSNRLARAAGYAPGVFYRHFRDKRALFLEVYRHFVEAEWQALTALPPGDPATRARAMVDIILGFHREWRGLRRSLHVLCASDPGVRRAYQRARARQLDWLAERAPHLPRERAALLLYLFERTSDGVAEGEPAALGLDPAELAAALAHELATALSPPAPVQAPPRRTRR
ncbi:MAG: TetR/AcrR family transcriptional regulator [Deltaproteobacteria bacterium]|nr:TetR/AcrR family transcriptional regulator [Deltaproteobacteria bacterium]